MNRLNVAMLVVIVFSMHSGADAASVLLISTGDTWANAVAGTIPGNTYTTVNAAAIPSVNFNNFNIVYVTDAYSNATTPAWASALIARQAAITSYINGGGIVIAGVENFASETATNGNEYKFLPAGLVSTPAGTQPFGDSVVISAPAHPLFSGLTNAALSNWSDSYHGTLPTGTLPILATNGSLPVIRGGQVGSGVVVVWSLDPDFHQTAGGHTLIQNAFAYGLSTAVPEPACVLSLIMGSVSLIFCRRRRA